MPRTLDYLTLLDWGSAGWGNPVYDFAGIPLRAAPFMLEGYRQVMPLPHEETAEARILWRNLTLALGNLHRGPEPALSWAERPLGFLMETLRFLLQTDHQRWRDLCVS